MKGGSGQIVTRPHKHRQAGFTIIETLIVLAITGVLFTLIASTISVRQNNAEFQQGVQTLQAQLQQEISHVADGYFPSDSSFSCSSGTGTLVIIGNSNTPEGSNTGCVFLGTVLQFHTSTAQDQYYGYSLVGIQDKTDYRSAKPLALAKGTNHTNAANFPDTLFETIPLRYSMQIKSINAYVTAADTQSKNGQSIAAFGFLSDLAQNSPTLASGTQVINVVPIYDTGLDVNTNRNDGVDHIDDYFANTDFVHPATPVMNPDQIAICLQSGGSSDRALVTIGGNGRRTNVDTQIGDSSLCN